jgi:FtsZ-binding cell division protein ZapB
MANSPKGVNELIPMIYSDIESKKKLVNNIRNEYLNNSNSIIQIKSLIFFDLLDEFEITISQSLQAIQTLQTEIWNLHEKLKHNNYSTINNEEFNIKDNPLYNSKDNICNYNFNPNHFDPPIEIDLSNSTKLCFDYSQIQSYSQIINQGNVCNNENPKTNQNEMNVYSNNNENILENSFEKNTISNYQQFCQNKIKSARVADVNPNIINKTVPAKVIQKYNVDDNNNNNNKNNNNENQLSETERILNNINEVSNNNNTNLSNKIPIRQSIRQRIKTTSSASKREKTISQDSDVNCNRITSYIIDAKINELLQKINGIDTYKIYFGDKYGNGDYNEFITKLNKNQLQKEVILDELTIISDLMQQQQLNQNKFRKGSTRNSSTTSNNIKSNNNNIANKKRQQSQNVICNKKQFNTCKANVYIEPVQFATYLRTDDHGCQRKRNMSFGKEKIYK